MTYFDELAEVSLELIGQFGLAADPLPLEKISKDLRHRVSEIRAESVRKLKTPQRVVKRGESSVSQGLNTIGTLSDRFTILLMKYWYLVNIYNDEDEARALKECNIAEVVDALNGASPGLSSMNTKMTTHDIIGEADSWEAAFYGLLTTNLVLWEAQEILYRADITVLPCEELRRYLLLFSEGNLTRNRFIELCEEQYWNGI